LDAKTGAKPFPYFQIELKCYRPQNLGISTVENRFLHRIDPILFPPVPINLTPQQRQLLSKQNAVTILALTHLTHQPRTEKEKHQFGKTSVNQLTLPSGVASSYD
jgi:hypothetical protein